jgi:hypothetical protein|tara:strand:+ start:1667 stop:1774 length:108 start_codon:yes stop_codon:yes gene_type:complete
MPKLPSKYQFTVQGEKPKAAAKKKAVKAEPAKEAE